MANPSCTRLTDILPPGFGRTRRTTGTISAGPKAVLEIVVCQARPHHQTSSHKDIIASSRDLRSKFGSKHLLHPFAILIITHYPPSIMHQPSSTVQHLRVYSVVDAGFHPSPLRMRLELRRCLSLLSIALQRGMAGLLAPAAHKSNDPEYQFLSCIFQQKLFVELDSYQAIVRP